MSKERIKYKGPVEKISIPNDDVNAWVKTLDELGWSADFIERFIGNLNELYARMSQLTAREEKIVNRIFYYQELKKERVLTEQEKQEFKQLIKILEEKGLELRE